MPHKFTYTSHLVVLSIILAGCAQYVFVPPIYPQDYWDKNRYTVDMIKVVDRSCGAEAKSNSICMLTKGFTYLDPNKTCRRSRNSNYLTCQSKNNNYKQPERKLDCYETGEVTAHKTCEGQSIQTISISSHSSPYIAIDPDYDNAIRLQNDIQNQNNRQMNSLLRNATP